MGTTFADITTNIASIFDGDELDEAKIVKIAHLSRGPGVVSFVTVDYTPYGDPTVRVKVSGLPTRPFMPAVRSAYERRFAAEHRVTLAHP